MARRTAAAESVAGVALPTTAEEIWRYGAIDDLDLDRYSPADPGSPPGPAPDGAQRWATVVGRRGGLVVTVDGRCTTAEVAPEVAAAGVVAGPLPADADAVLGRGLGEPPDVFAAMNDAASPEPVVVSVPPGVAVEHPVVIVHAVATDGVMALPRLVIDAGEDAEVTVVEVLVSDDVSALAVPVTEVVAEPAARVRHVLVQALGPQVWNLGTVAARVERDATAVTAMAALGGAYGRIRSDAHLVGRGARGEQLAVYLGHGQQVLDFRTLQDHVAPKTSSDLLFKGAVGDRARSVYSGLIRVGADAAGTDAHQTNRTLKLSEGAWAESVPNLEILTNDVRCSHASAVGPVDADQLFYLESRGVPTDRAERLLVTGFFGEVLERVPVTPLAEHLGRVIAERIRRGEEGER